MQLTDQRAANQDPIREYRVFAILVSAMCLYKGTENRIRRSTFWDTTEWYMVCHVSSFENRKLYIFDYKHFSDLQKGVGIRSLFQTGKIMLQKNDITRK